MTTEPPKPPKTFLILLTSRPHDAQNYIHRVLLAILGMAKEYEKPPPGTLKIVLIDDGIYAYMKKWNAYAYKHSDWRMDLVAEWFPHFCEVYEVYALDESMKERGLTLDSLFNGVKICSLDDIAEWCTTQDYVIAF